MFISGIIIVAHQRDDLRGWKLNRTMFIADAGVNPMDNRTEFVKTCGRYLMGTRMNNAAEVRDQILSKKGRYRAIQNNLQAKEVIIGNGERRRRYILCYNPKEAIFCVEALNEALDRYGTPGSLTQIKAPSLPAKTLFKL